MGKKKVTVVIVLICIVGALYFTMQMQVKHAENILDTISINPQPDDGMNTTAHANKDDRRPVTFKHIEIDNGLEAAPEEDEEPQGD